MMANQDGVMDIKSTPGDLPVSHFVESKDYETVHKELEGGKRVILLFGKSGQGKTQIGNYLMSGWSKEKHHCFFFQTQTHDSYKVSYSSILEKNSWNQDTKCPGDFDFAALCEYIDKKRIKGKKVLFHFDDLKTFDEDGNATVTIKGWIKKLYDMILRFSSSQLKDMQLLITVPEEPAELNSKDIENVYMYKMKGFQSDDIKKFFENSFQHTPPKFLDDRADEIADKMGQSPQLYKAKLDMFRAMMIEKELTEFLEDVAELDGETAENIHTNAIKQRLRHLRYLPIWKVMTNFDRINIPSNLLYAVLVYCREAKKLGFKGNENHRVIFAEMRSEYLRSEFVTEYREGINNQQGHWTIHTEVQNCLKELVKEDGAEEQREYLIVGLMAMASIVDRDDRFHSDKREYTSRHVNMLSQASALHYRIELSETTDPCLSDYQQLAVYQLLTGLYYAKLKKVGSELDKNDLKDFYERIKKLEGVLKKQTMSGEGVEQLSFTSEDGPTEETVNRYQSMLGYLEEDSEDDCEIALRLYRFSDRDEKTFKDYLKERKVKIKFRPNAQHFGMFTKKQLKALQNANLVLAPQFYRQVYPLEVLASMYIILGMMREHVKDLGDADSDGLQFWAQSSYNIFCHVTDNIFKVIEETANQGFMQKVIIERDKVFGNSENQDHMDFGEIKKLYEDLKNLKEVYEYGFLRSNMSTDNYHHLICNERLLEAIGNLVIRANAAGTDQTTQISMYVEEGLELCPSTKSLIVDNPEFSQKRASVWRQYAYNMEYVAMFMMKCGQTLEGFRYYTYALYSFYEYTDRKKDKIVTEEKFIKMCIAIVELANPQPSYLTGAAAETVREQVIERCICLFKPSAGDTACGNCSNNGLSENFLRDLELSETGLPVVSQAINILIRTLTPSTEPTAPE